MSELDPRVKKQQEVALHKFLAGKKFMSFDVEVRNGVFNELGITLFSRFRPMETFNYRDRDIVREEHTFIFGRTIKADLEVVRTLVNLHAESCDFYVGHSINYDFGHLKNLGIELPDKFYYDTAMWSKGMFGYKKSLGDLCREYHLGQKYFHCGGNDSRYTADVFLKMIHDQENIVQR